MCFTFEELMRGRSISPEMIANGDTRPVFGAAQIDQDDTNTEGIGRSLK